MGQYTLLFTDDDGKSHRYTPDVMVWRTNGAIELHEVTISARRGREDQQRREHAAQIICAMRGWEFVVHTEASLPQPTERANLLMLALFRPPAVASSVVLAAYRRVLPLGSVVAFADLTEQLIQTTSVAESDVTRTLCHLIWHGEIKTDLKRLLFIDGQPVPGLKVWRGGDAL